MKYNSCQIITCVSIVVIVALLAVVLKKVNNKEKFDQCELITSTYNTCLNNANTNEKIQYCNQQYLAMCKAVGSACDWKGCGNLPEKYCADISGGFGRQKCACDGGKATGWIGF